ncbi:M23 family metallopeptidase, partial [bacterium]|nr:M23 family metallopeptidase [bacterium]
MPPTLVPTAVATLPRVDHYVLSRPFPRSETLVDYADRTYAYGSTQGGARDVHLGVDYANVRHTPVLAVGAGTVIFAETDSSTRVGPAYDYYGNTVIVQHDTSAPNGEPLYTLYGHLQEIYVPVGKYVTPGDPLGTVGGQRDRHRATFASRSARGRRWAG